MKLSTINKLAKFLSILCFGGFAARVIDSDIQTIMVFSMVSVLVMILTSILIEKRSEKVNAATLQISQSALDRIAGVQALGQFDSLQATVKAMLRFGEDIIERVARGDVITMTPVDENEDEYELVYQLGKELPPSATSKKKIVRVKLDVSRDGNVITVKNWPKKGD